MHPRKMIKRRKSLRLVRSISRVLDSSAAVAALPGATQTLQVLPGSAGDLFPAAAERLDQRCKNDGMKCLKGYENIKKNMDRATFPIGTIRREQVVRDTIYFVHCTNCTRTAEGKGHCNTAPLYCLTVYNCILLWYVMQVRQRPSAGVLGYVYSKEVKLLLSLCNWPMSHCLTHLVVIILYLLLALGPHSLDAEKTISGFDIWGEQFISSDSAASSEAD